MKSLLRESKRVEFYCVPTDNHFETGRWSQQAKRYRSSSKRWRHVMAKGLSSSTENERLSYADFHERVRSAARGLHSLGVQRGDKVAVWMGNQTEWLVLAFAASYIGATFVALNTWWRAKELQHALSLADVSVLVFCSEYARTDYLSVIRSIDRTALPHLRVLVCLGDTDLGDTDSDADIIRYESFIGDGRDVAAGTVDQIADQVDPKDIAFILFTSGSSARPKAVQNEHLGLIRNLYQIGERLHLSSTDKVHLSISLFWGFGIANAVFAVMTHGACLVLQHQFDAQEALHLIEREACTALYATPNMALALKDHPDRPSTNLRTLRTGLGMPAATKLMIELGAKEACSLYGLTECYGNSAVSDASLPDAVRSFTCGRALPNTEIKIADPITHLPVSPGETGEIALRGYVMPGYYKNPEETAAAMDRRGSF